MADEPIVIGMASTLESLYYSSYKALAPAWQREDPEGWNREYAQKMLRMGAVLGAETLALNDARAAGWDVAAPEVIAEHSLVMRLPDGRIGYHMPDKRYPNAPAKKLGDPIREHLTAFLTGKGGGMRPTGLPELPAICRAVLQADGLDPDAVERLGATIHKVSLTIDGRHHVATMSMKKAFFLERMAILQSGNHSPPPLEQYEWAGIKMTLSKDPGIHILDGKLTARVQLPASIAGSLVGRPAITVLDHPALHGHTITRATQRATGFTITLRKDEP